MVLVNGDDKKDEREKSCSTRPPVHERTRVEIIHSYWDVETSGHEVGDGEKLIPGVEGKTTAELQGPTGYSGIYSTWNIDVDNADGDRVEVTGRDDPWDFGTAEQYPVLRIDFDGDGEADWQEFGVQREGQPTPTPVHPTATATLVPTSTPTPVPPTATATPVPTPTPTPVPSIRYGHTCADSNPDPGPSIRYGHTCADSNPDPGAVDRYGHTCADSNPDPGAVDRYGHAHADSNPDPGPADRHGQTGADFNSNSGPADRHGHPSADAFTAGPSILVTPSATAMAAPTPTLPPNGERPAVSNWMLLVLGFVGGAMLTVLGLLMIRRAKGG